MQSLNKIQPKLYKELRSQDTQCLYALVEVEPNNDLVQIAKKGTQINLKITGKPHAHLQAALTKYL